jgi:hypothetical protein
MKSRNPQSSDRRKDEKSSQAPNLQAPNLQARNLQAPWPDQKARQEMSQSDLACDDGKHGKNSDWKKTW